MNLTTREAIERSVKLLKEQEVKEVIAILSEKPCTIDEMVVLSPFFRDKSSYIRTLTKMTIYEFVNVGKIKNKTLYSLNTNQIDKIVGFDKSN